MKGAIYIGSRCPWLIGEGAAVMLPGEASREIPTGKLLAQFDRTNRAPGGDATFVDLAYGWHEYAGSSPAKRA